MWSHIHERRLHSQNVARFGLASNGETAKPEPGSSQGLQDRQRADIGTQACLARNIGTAFSEKHAERQQSLLASQSFGSGAVELSPLEDPSCCIEEKLEETSALKTRFAQMIEYPQYPSSHAKSTKKYCLRSKESDLARAGSIPQTGPSLAATIHTSQSRPVHTLHSLTGAPGQLQSARRIPDLFRTKRPIHGDVARTSKKLCVRPTLSAAFCSTPFAQELSAHNDDFYSVSSQMVSAFDAPYHQPEEVNQENVAARDMMQADEMIVCDEACDNMPCGMAPMPHSPMFNSEPVGFSTGFRLASAGKFTPDATHQLASRMLAVSPSVHTPPECMAVVPEQPPGAPRKRTKSSSSSMSGDSFDACESVFAPGAPDWSPRTAVCRVLKFDDEMDG